MIDGLNHFAKAPADVGLSRSRFDRSHTYSTTFQAGDIIPVFCDEVLPGDTFDLSTAFVLRNLTPVAPIMDNAFFDYYYFFVPNRIIAPWNFSGDWEEICGANKKGYWAATIEKRISSAPCPANVAANSLAAYFGLPIGSVGSYTINPYPFIAYWLIWDEFFRDQNTQTPVLVSSSSISTLFNVIGNAGSCLKANKFHDIFTSCLPAPQKGDSVQLPLGSLAPVITGDAFSVSGNPALGYSFVGPGLSGADSYWPASSVQGSSGADGVASGSFNSTAGMAPNNLYADLSEATAATVNQLRQAFAIQRLLERDARSGTRYKEVLKAHFDVNMPDYTLQRPEYLGGKRVPINVTQVLQTSATAEGGSPLGFTGAFSNTFDSDKSFLKSFGEFGYVIGVAVVRTSQSYSQGVPKMFERFRRFDFYWPVFANLGEQPIYTYELFAQPSGNSLGDDVFGYQEAWAHYRYKPSMVTGELAPNANNESFVPWTYTNDFSAAPVLNSQFMVQSPSVVAKTLIDTTTTAQYLLNMAFNLYTTRAMPIYSIPGLIDHH